MRLIQTLILAVCAFLLRKVGAQHAIPARAPEEQHDPPSGEALKEGHETADFHPRWIVYAILGLFLAIFAAMGATALMYAHYYDAHSALAAYTLPPEEKTGIARDWETIRRETQARLEGYHWVDRKAGTVTVPIERAMELVAHEGLPARAGQTPDFPAPDKEPRTLEDLSEPQN